MRIFKLLFLLVAILPIGNIVQGQRMDWKDFTKSPSSTTRDYGAGSDPGMAWSVALGTPLSRDGCRDAIALNDGGFLVLGTNVYNYDIDWDLVHTDLVLYRLTENGELVWEKRYDISNYKFIYNLRLIEKANKGFIVAGNISNEGTSIRKLLLVNFSPDGDSISTVIHSEEPYHIVNVRIINDSDAESDSFFLYYKVESWTPYQEISNTLKRLNFEFNEDWTINATSFSVVQESSLAKEWGIFVSSFYDNIRYFKKISTQGVVIDSFPSPFQNPSISFLPLKGVNNAFFNKTANYVNKTINYELSLYVLDDFGNTILNNPICISGANQGWFNDSNEGSYIEMADGTLVGAFSWHYYLYDTQCIALSKMRPNGELLGDTVLIRYTGDMVIKGVVQGGDGKLVIYGYATNGPLGGYDIFIAKLATWNPTGISAWPVGNSFIKAYPNPASKHIVINFAMPLFGHATITNLTGAPIKRIELNGKIELTIDLSEFTNGLYVLTVFDANGQHSGSTKFVVKN